MDLRDIPSGEFVFQKDLFDLPGGLELVSVNPATMKLSFEPSAVKIVPVTVTTVDFPRPGMVVAEKRVKPSKVAVRGAASVVAALSEVRTPEISLLSFWLRRRCGKFAPPGKRSSRQTLRRCGQFLGGWVHQRQREFPPTSCQLPARLLSGELHRINATRSQVKKTERSPKQWPALPKAIHLRHCNHDTSNESVCMVKFTT